MVVPPAAVAAVIGATARARDRGDGRWRGDQRGLDRDTLCRRSAGVGRVSDQGRIAVGVSGAGSNLRALAAAAARGDVGGAIVLVFADRACPALDWATEQGIETALVPGGDDATLGATLSARRGGRGRPRGYMRIVGPAVLAAFPGRILNTHPSLLPAFPGAHAVADALAHGVTVTGCTVHLVDETLDGGPIVAQEAVAVMPGDDAERLHERIRAVEHRLLPRAVGLAARRRHRRRAGWAASHDRHRHRRRGHPDPTTGAALGLGQDRARAVRGGARRGRVRARLDRGHGPGASRGRPARHRRRRGDRVPGDARRTGQDPPSAGPRGHPGRSALGRSSPPAHRGRDRAVRARRRQPLSIRGRGGEIRGSAWTSSSRRSTSAVHRWSARRPRTTPMSRSSPRRHAMTRSWPRWPATAGWGRAARRAGHRGVPPYRRLRRPDRRGPAAADGRGRRPAAG